MSEQGNGQRVRGKGSRGRWLRVTRLHLTCPCGVRLAGLLVNRTPMYLRCPGAVVDDKHMHLDATVVADRLHSDLDIGLKVFRGFVQQNAKCVKSPTFGKGMHLLAKTSFTRTQRSGDKSPESLGKLEG